MFIREAEGRLLLLLAKGMSDRAIARCLGVSLRTVERRVAELHTRLGAKSRFQLAVLALLAGLIEPGALGQSHLLAQDGWLCGNCVQSNERDAESRR
ncbi:helix-turn-helix domain-containing protein [Nonomuraea jabiensis]|uniref:DNA-binding CsgD family transcriptional regulator n=1 Tax=Nonomuraea jabiensis TaxID=882448 RepID=A0A7W9L7M0_9ACTN|nr:helix-turn-helix transcriptional regulator [Nonomuraea jabiensis]MBB5773622.1 DNA-binding CsgD family transcriptional regulator [Nonomuraea jabiensis]